MTIEDCVQALAALGFTGLEAECYAFLVRESPATGYRVAQALSKPAANVYKALEALQHKGALLVDEGESRLFRAVPSQELLARLTRSFGERRARAERALAGLQGAGEDDRVYQLHEREQVLERCRTMLSRARHNAVLDVCPLPLEALRPDIEAAAARGVEVVLKVFEPAEVAGAEVVLNANAQAVMGLYPGQWVILIVDGAEFLLTFLEPDGVGVHQAIWSGSTCLSYLFYCAFISEIGFHLMLTRVEGVAAREEVRAAFQPIRGLFASDVPGYQALLERFGAPPARRKR